MIIYVYNRLILVFQHAPISPKPVPMAATPPSCIVQHLQRFGHASPDDLPGVVEDAAWATKGFFRLETMAKMAKTYPI